MNYYVATSYTNKVGAHLLVELINSSQDQVLRELTVTSRWLDEPVAGDSFKEQQARTLKDLEDIDAADFVISLNPYGYGTSAEQGYTLGTGKPLIVMMDSEDEDHSFIAYCSGHRNVSIVQNFAELVEQIYRINQL